MRSKRSKNDSEDSDSILPLSLVFKPANGNNDNNGIGQLANVATPSPTVSTTKSVSAKCNGNNYAQRKVQITLSSLFIDEDCAVGAVSGIEDSIASIDFVRVGHMANAYTAPHSFQTEKLHHKHQHYDDLENIEKVMHCKYDGKNLHAGYEHGCKIFVLFLPCLLFVMATFGWLILFMSVLLQHIRKQL